MWYRVTIKHWYRGREHTDCFEYIEAHCFYKLFRNAMRHGATRVARVAHCKPDSYIFWSLTKGNVTE